MTAVKALATTEDRASMVRGVRIALKIAGQRALRQHQRAVHLAPASDSETDIWDFVKRRSHGLYRQSRPHLTRGRGFFAPATHRIHRHCALRVSGILVVLEPDG